MNHSIATAACATHLTNVVVALIGATVVAGIGISACVVHAGSSRPASQLTFHLDHLMGPNRDPLQFPYKNCIDIEDNS